MTLPDLLRRITAILDESAIPYMLTGSLAASFYALPRATRDIDLVVEASPDELAGLAARLEAAGFYVSVDAAREAGTRGGQFNAIDPESGWKIDFIVRKARPFSVLEFSRRRATTILGIELDLATAEDLIVAKLEWAKKGDSEMQLRDVRALLREGPVDLDREYVGRWVEELGLGALWERVKGIVGAED